MKKYIVSMFILTLVIPSIAFASWWNPFSWNWKALFNSPVKNETQVISPVISPVVNTETTNNTKTISPTIKDTPKSIPAVDNSATLKSEVQAKIDAGLKAKAELDALVAKQKADEQARIDAEQKLKAEQDALLTKQNEEVLAKAEEAQKKYQNQYNKVQTKMDDLQEQYDKLMEQSLGTSCAGQYQGLTGANCLAYSQQAGAVMEYKSAIFSNFITPVTDTTIEYENKLDDLNQKVFQLKMDYYKSVANMAGSPMTTNTYNGRVAQLLTASNAKIDALNQEIQFTWSNYKMGINP